MSEVETKRLLDDGGSLAELISPQLAIKRNLPVGKCKKEVWLKLADASISPIRHYALILIVVEDMLTMLRAYIK